MQSVGIFSANKSGKCVGLTLHCALHTTSGCNESQNKLKHGHSFYLLSYRLCSGDLDTKLSPASAQLDEIILIADKNLTLQKPKYFIYYAERAKK